MPELCLRTFKSGNSTAVRLPKALGIGVGVELIVSSDAQGLHMRRPRTTIAEAIAALQAMPKPDLPEVRDTEEIPERPGLLG